MLYTTTGASEFIPDAAGAYTLKFRATDQLYRLSVIADARDYDWDELYVELHDFGNGGQRTGPWDFHPAEGNRALMPSYWVFLNGEKLGLWFFSRVSLADIEAKQFRGHMAVWPPAGENELRLVPYRPMNLYWFDARFEADPVDCLLSCDEALLKNPGQSTLPGARWSDKNFWSEKRAQLETTHAHFRGPLQCVFDRALAQEEAGHNDILLLLAAHHLCGLPHALEAARRAVDAFLETPHWGNPLEDGYQHDGDSGAALTFRALTWAYFALDEKSDAERRRRILDKLALQADRFVRQAFLNRDYWGGSLLQGHGWRSMLTFGGAVLHLMGVLPQAARWIRFVVPRIERALRAMPPDGVLHPGVGNSVHLYLDALADYRDAFREYSGRDIYDDVPWQNILRYIVTVLREEELVLAGQVLSGQSMVNFIGGQAFFNHLAAKHHDGDAAYLQQLSLRAPHRDFGRHSEPYSFAVAPLMGFLSYEPRETPPSLTYRPPALAYFSDSGLVHYHCKERDITLSLQCGPLMGHHAYRHARGPCDRMTCLEGFGHFHLARGGVNIITSPAGSYQMRSLQRNCLLIDGQGPQGDIGYPMSLPDWRHRGEEIESVRWDESTQTGFVRLNLAPAYHREQSVVTYTRDFLIEPNAVTVRDHVALSTPHSLSWLFQGSRAAGITRSDNGSYRFGDEAGVLLHAAPGETKLTSRIAPTPTVWSYSNVKNAVHCDHVRYDTDEAVQLVTADFILSW